MKKFLPLLFIFAGFTASAQIVNIPDPVFKSVLVNYYDILNRPIDTNHDGEIQVSEAEAFSHVTDYLFLSGKNISDLTGIKAFTFLRDLFCNGNNLTSLDVSGMQKIEIIFCYDNVLSTINISGCSVLKNLYCNNNNLSSIDLSGQNQLTILTLGGNDFSLLDVSSAPLLSYLDCSNNHLTTLDVSQVPLVGMDCSYNQLTSLNVKNNKNFTYSCCAFSDFKCLGNPGLQYICADAGEVLFMLEYYIQNGMPSVQIDPNCSFSTSNGYGTVNGIARIDLDNNGCSLADPVKPALQLKLINDGDTAQQLSKTTDVNGEYTFYTYGGNHSVVPTLVNPYYTISPDTLHFTTTTGTVQNFDFCIIPTGSHNDLDIKISYAYAFGDTAFISLQYRNKGTTTLSGVIQLDFDDNKLNFVNAQPAITAQSTGHLEWNFSNLQPFETRTGTIIWYMLPDPINHIGDTLNFIANIDAGTDETPADNTFTFNAPITYVVLPITMEYFRGSSKSGKHYLNWKANCTSLQAKFNIERSTDSRTYQSIGNITASNTRCLQPFDFIDINPAAGINYYRIKMTDVDGKISYSTIIALLNKKTGFEIVNLLPNPVVGGKAILNITAAEKQLVHISITDAIGKTVQVMDQQVIAGFTQVNMNLGNLAAGIYTITITTADNERKTIRFVKQ